MSNIENTLLLQSAMIDNYNRYAEGLDSKNWAMVRACFADEILIDYGDISAPTGHPDVPRRADDWMKNLQAVINGFDITRHMITNHRFTVSEKQISCRAYLRADHVMFANPEMPAIAPGEMVTVVGEYNNHYAQVDGIWQICKSELVVNWSEGNLSLLAIATERSMAKMGGV